MDGSRFDALSRALGADHSRRGLTRVLGGLLLGGAAVWQELTSAAAKKGGKKGGKNAKKRAERKCKQQVAQCRTFVAQQCANGIDPAACAARADPCCERFATCQALDALTCLASVDIQSR